MNRRDERAAIRVGVAAGLGAALVLLAQQCRAEETFETWCTTDDCSTVVGRGSDGSRYTDRAVDAGAGRYREIRGEDGQGNEWRCTVSCADYACTRTVIRCDEG